MDAGIWLPPSQYEAAFVSTAHGAAEVAATLEAAQRERFGRRGQASRLTCGGGRQ